MSAAGPASGRARLVQIDPSVVGPRRRCVGCRRPGDRSVLLRFAVVDRDGDPTVVLDERRSLPGRGAWLHPDLGCWELATRRSALTRALRTGARIDHDGITSALTALCTASSTEHDELD